MLTAFPAVSLNGVLQDVRSLQQGMELTLTFDGPDEDAAAASMAEFLKANL